MKTNFYFLLTIFALSLVSFNAMAQKKLLFVGGNDPLDIEDQHIVDSLLSWGYEVTPEEDGNFKNTYVDISFFDAYDGVVVSESISSGNGEPLLTIDFKKPIFNYEGFLPKAGKWNWLPDDELFWYTVKPDGFGTVDALTAIVVDNTHYITEGYALDEEIVTSTKADSLGENVGFDLSTAVPDAVPLAKSKEILLDGKHILWAIDEGTMVPGTLGPVAAERMVIFAVHKRNLAPGEATQAFFDVSKKSLEWVLGAESTVAVRNIESGFSGVKLLNNPVRENGIIRFNLKEAGMVSITAVNLIGQQVILKSNESYSAGQHEISFNTSEFNNGIYIYQLNTKNSIYSGKMHIVK